MPSLCIHTMVFLAILHKGVTSSLSKHPHAHAVLSSWIIHEARNICVSHDSCFSYIMTLIYMILIGISLWNYPLVSNHFWRPRHWFLNVIWGLLIPSHVCHCIPVKGKLMRVPGVHFWTHSIVQLQCRMCPLNLRLMIMQTYFLQLI